MEEVKNIIGIIAVILTFVGYAPYFRDIIKGKTKPHIYSWFLWAFVTFIAFALQITFHAGTGAYVTLTASLMCAVVLILGLSKKGKQDITKMDTLFFILALISLFVWFVAKQPVVSAVLVTLTDLLGFVPTIRKSWNHPHTEILSFYVFNSFRFFMAILALQNYSIITTVYPVTWCLANFLFAIVLITRRKSLA